jgi:hypothetical protein
LTVNFYAKVIPRQNRRTQNPGGDLEKRKPARVLAAGVYKAVREKLDEVFREKRRKLVRFAFFKLGNQADAEDAVQNGCVIRPQDLPGRLTKPKTPESTPPSLSGKVDKVAKQARKAAAHQMMKETGRKCSGVRTPSGRQ